MISTRQATFKTLHSFPDGYIFTSIELKNRVVEITGKSCLDSSTGRHLREYRELYGRDIVCIDKQKSKYKVIGYGK